MNKILKSVLIIAFHVLKTLLGIIFITSFSFFICWVYDQPMIFRLQTWFWLAVAVLAMVIGGCLIFSGAVVEWLEDKIDA